MRALARCACAAVLLIGSVQAFAKDFPTGPITLIVPFPPGGGGDITFRLVGERLAQKLGQPVVIENRAGASGDIGFAAGAKAARTGYILTGLAAPVVINPVVMKAATVDPTRDYAPVGSISTYYLMIVVNGAAPYRSLNDLLSAARGKPGEVPYASLGGSVELSKIMLEHRAGIRFSTIKYKGSSEQMRAVLGGEVAATAVPLRVALPLINDGKLRALGYYGPTRNSALPDIPAVSEVVPGVSVGSWVGLAAPAGTPPDIVGTLNQALNSVLQDADLQRRIHASGDEVTPSTPAAFAAKIREELTMYRELARQAGIVPE